MRRRGVGALAASPTMVGAITTLIVILAVFLAYNANNGLPFVPTYRISRRRSRTPTRSCPATRSGSAASGSASSSRSSRCRTRDGRRHAKLDLKLDKDVDPLPDRLDA